jgi:hypothetical protein
VSVIAHASRNHSDLLKEHDPFQEQKQSSFTSALSSMRDLSQVLKGAIDPLKALPDGKDKDKALYDAFVILLQVCVCLRLTLTHSFTHTHTLTLTHSHTSLSVVLPLGQQERPVLACRAEQQCACKHATRQG